MRHSLIAAGLFSAAALLLAFMPEASAPRVELTVDGTPRTDATTRVEAFEVRLDVLPALAKEQRIDLSFRATPASRFYVDSQPATPTCVDGHCHLIVVTQGQDVRIVAVASHASGADTIDFQLREVRVVKQRGTTPLDQEAWWLAGIGFVLLVIAIQWLHAYRVASQWLLVASAGAVLFWLQPMFSLLLAVFLCVSHYLGTRGQGSRLILWSGIAAAVAILLGFKYGAPALVSLFANPGRFPLALPLGLSYFLIRLIDTQMRWFRGEGKDVGLREYLCYVVFPSTLPAGPIHTLPGFIEGRLERITGDDRRYGIARMCLGLVKKLAIADLLLYAPLFSAGGLLDRVVATGVAPGLEVVILLCGAFLFVYVDFSAYSDLAIGAGRLLGYRIPENFDLPVLATNIRDYWRRWHMTLSGWCMRNIYFPLLLTTRNPYVAPFAVMTAVGLWHALSLSWLAWAVHHGGAIMAQNLWEQRRGRRKQRERAALTWGRALGIPATVLFVSAGHAFAQIHDFGLATKLYGAFWQSLLGLPFALIG
jgi:alginate O-acetyltransferase complex protein AlgI